MPSHFDIAADEDTTPRRPPGLLPLPGERLWQPHEDGYWKSLRAQWGSTLDIHEEDEDSATVEESEESASAASTAASAMRSFSRSDAVPSQENNMVVDEQGTVFHIVLPDRSTGPTPVNHKHNHHQPPAPDNSHRNTATITFCKNGSSRRIKEEGEPSAAVEQTTRDGLVGTNTRQVATIQSKSKSSSAAAGKRAFKAVAPLNVSVTTTTRTYGDFSRMNPPPYTPRPTGTERSFGRNDGSGNGKMPVVVDDKDEEKTRWPVAKWLFIFGFVFPLLWLFGSFLLFTGLRKLCAEHQEEEEEAARSQTHATANSSTNSSTDKHTFDTLAHTHTHSRTHTSTNTVILDTHHHHHQARSVTHLIAQEVRWSKRCAWAIVIFACLCFTALGVLKAVGI
ncbi:hypothetical protein FRC17_004180 [Serendipita sp. 399]|nr:hypothetical protein FRC17_004180 [Serendipita sp. 399]